MAVEMKIIQTGGPNLFGIHIRRLRKDKKLKQIDIIRKMQLKGYDITSYSYSRIESGKINPTMRFIKEFVEILEIDYNILFSFLDEL